MTLAISGEPSGQHLDRDVAPEPGVASPVHLPHPAHADQASNLEAGDPAAVVCITPLPSWSELYRCERTVQVLTRTA
jgi:hypothetical protein